MPLLSHGLNTLGMKTLPILLLALGLALPAAAQTTRYVSDTLQVPLLAGAGARHKILRMVGSGTELQVLRNEAASGYSLVKTGDGLQGWILTRYLMAAPHTRETATAVPQSVVPAASPAGGVSPPGAALPGTQPEQELARLRQENQRLSQELAQIRKTAANAVAIDQQNRTLQERTVGLEREVQILQQENRSLADRSAQHWVLVGAGVLVLGLVLGLILPRLRFQKKARWGDL